jgi:hypothetical protein
MQATHTQCKTPDSARPQQQIKERLRDKPDVLGIDEKDTVPVKAKVIFGEQNHKSWFGK